MFYSKKYSEGVNYPNKFREILYLDIASLMNVSEEDNYLRCIYCHYVFDDQKEQFEKHIINLKDKGNFISTEKIIRILEGQERPYRKKFSFVI